MNASLIVSNILNPPVLFFLGMVAVFVKSDLEIPALQNYYPFAYSPSDLREGS